MLTMVHLAFGLATVLYVFAGIGGENTMLGHMERPSGSGGCSGAQGHQVPESPEPTRRWPIRFGRAAPQQPRWIGSTAPT